MSDESNLLVIHGLMATVDRLQEQVEKIIARTVVSNNSAWFSAYASVTTSVGTTGLIAVTLDQTKYTDGHFASNVYTCPVAGNYLFNGAAFVIATAAGLVFASLTKAGSEISRGFEFSVAAGGSICCPVSDVLQCAQGDVIGLAVRAYGAGVVQTGPAVTRFSGQIQ